MKKNLLIIAAIASATLVSCSSDEFGGEENYPIPVQDAPIAFGSYFKAMTRADLKGAEAAEKLGNKFVVSGYKGNSTATVGSMVFDNYLVEWAENTANTTESNSDNWEYVGKGLIKHAIDAGITKQTIKYWDYSSPQYDFIAWSTGTKKAIYEGTPDAARNEVLVSAITPETATGVPAANEDAKVAYTFTGSAANLSQCYIADLVTVKKDGSTASKYQDPVTFRFRQLGTKVRIAIYETVPGYSVKNVKFYTKDGVLDDVDNQIVDDATIFTTEANEIYTEGTYTVYFPTVDQPDDADNNQAHVSFAGSGTQSTVVDWGGMDYTYRESGEKSDQAVYLGRTSNTATFANKDNADQNYYEIYLPNETGTNLNLRVNFTLESIDGSGEIIEVKNAKAQVPLIYTQWKPGYAYTYLFKISDNTNGRTGNYDPTKPDDDEYNSDPAGLYPITFDAVVVNAEDGNNTQETITTISTPSITTYQMGSNVVNDDEYTEANYIYVTVNENDELVTLTSNNTKVYSLPNDRNYTEAEVIDALSFQNDVTSQGATITGRSGLDLTEKAVAYVKEIKYGVDGNKIKVIDPARATRINPTAGTNYAFVYTKTPANATEELFQPCAWDDFANETKYRYAYKVTAPTHTYNDGTTDVDAYDAQKGHVYFTENQGVYSRVNEPFIGQGVSNLYLDENGRNKASGYAVTGTKYYYTINGQTFTEAHNVAYGDDWATGLYEATTDLDHYPEGYKTTNDATPVDGKAYYFKNANNKYIYCVFMPQQVNGMYELDTEADKVEADEADEVVGQTYFDKYTKNDAVRYVKVIKVQ